MPSTGRRVLAFHRLVRLRAATSSDVGFLADVVISATRDQGRMTDGVDEADFRRGFEAWTADQVAGRVTNSHTYVIEVDGERAGRLRVVRDGRVVELAGVQLVPRFQSRGIGSEILVSLKAEASSAGLALELSVDTDNPRAQALYERHGLVVIGSANGENRMHWSD